MNRLPNSLHALDVASLVHPQSNLRKHLEHGPTIYSKGKGIFIYDEDGREYLEAAAGLWCASLGFGVERLAKVAYDQMCKVGYYHIYRSVLERERHRARGQAARDGACADVEGLLPVLGLGSERHRGEGRLVLLARPRQAGEAQDHRPQDGLSRLDLRGGLDLRQARHAPGIGPSLRRVPPHRIPELLSQPASRRDRGRLLNPHGAGAGGPDHRGRSRRPWPPSGPSRSWAPAALSCRPKGYFEKMQAVLQKYDILFVADEVICGFGRTGNMWGSETYDLKPDMISCAKALSAGLQPISALLLNERVFQALMIESDKVGHFAHGYTYAGHPVTTAVALETLKIYEEMDMVGHVRKVEKPFLAELKALESHPLIGEFRGIGLIGALEVVKDKATREMYPADIGIMDILGRNAKKHGLILRLVGNRIAFSPPLIIYEAKCARWCAACAVRLMTPGPRSEQIEKRGGFSREMLLRG